jgi:hypothetical protein
VAEKTKKLSDRVREVMDTLAEALEGLLGPSPVLVPVRISQPHPPRKRRR